MDTSLGHQGEQDQSSADAERRSRGRLATAIRAIPLGALGWGPKMLLEHLHSLASSRENPEGDLVATTQPQLADALGCAQVTAGEMLDALEDLRLIAIERRLYRGEKDDRAPNLRDGGSILRLNREPIFRLATRNRGPLGNRYQPPSEAALAQADERQRALQEELAALRAAHGQLATELQEVRAFISTLPPPPAQPAKKGGGKGMSVGYTRHRIAPYGHCGVPTGPGNDQTNGSYDTAAKGRRAA